MKNHLVLAAAIATVFASISAPVSGYKLATQSSAEERKLSGIRSSYFAVGEQVLARWSVSNFTEPVHEEITNRIYGCNGDFAVCGGASATFAPASVLAGVRWNDDPPFRLSPGHATKAGCKSAETIRFETQPSCWVRLFKDAEKGGVVGKVYGQGDAMLYRTHFGDLQFLHAMASRDGESAGETKANIMGWFEFAWRASQREYTLDTRLREVDNQTIKRLFGKTEWRLLDLYTLGSAGGLRQSVDDVAFGSLLHALEDSYAAGHTDREVSSGSGRCTSGNISFVAPGAILSFHSYGHQDHALHGEADSRESFMRQFQEKGNVVDVGRALVEARAQGLTWEAVRPLVDCAMAVHDPSAQSGPGDF